MKKAKLIMSMLLFAVLTFGTTTQAFAASKSFMDQVRSEYGNYEKKASAAYSAFHKKTNSDYAKYRDRQKASLDRFIAQTERDLSDLGKVLNEDVKQLEAQNAGSSDYSSKIREYKSAISVTSLSSPMSEYASSINPTSLSSYMSQ